MLCEPEGRCWCAEMPNVSPMPVEAGSAWVCGNCLRALQRIVTAKRLAMEENASGTAHD